MQTPALLSQLSERLTAQRVFGEAQEQDGVTVIPAARVLAGGGFGRDANAAAADINGGLGIVAYPVGAWVIKDGEVSWRPAWDVNRVVIGAQALIVGVALARRLQRRRRR